MRVLVCGGREYKNRIFLYKILNELHAAKEIDCIITGGANGADRLAAEWALDHNVNLIVMQAFWSKAGNSAGHQRNHRMLRDGVPDEIVAFPGGTGTANMISQARAWTNYPLRIIEVKDD